MSLVILDLEEDLVQLLGEANEPLEQTAKELIVVELYRRETITSGKAAELLGMSKLEFIRHASALGIPYFTMTKDEWEAEMRLIDSKWPH